MRILLDAKDLINIAEHNRPFDVGKFRDWLLERDACAVLSYSNISDFVGPAYIDNKFLEMRVLLQRIETLPLVYIREGTIIGDELAAALAAYKLGRDPTKIDPYVSRWDETAKWDGEAATRLLVGMRLHDLVYMARGTIQAYKRATPTLRRQIVEERVLPKDERLSPKEIFLRGIPERLRVHGIDEGGVNLEAFGLWLWKDPRRCLGLRLHFDARQHLVKDHTLELQDGDIADFAHIAAIPYVDVVTVDKRIGDLVTKTFQALRKTHPSSELSSRVFRSVERIMQAYPGDPRPC